MKSEAIVEVADNNILAPFDKVAAAVNEIVEKEKNIVFDYEDPKGNKDARSHRRKLQTAKADIARVHKAVKADVLAISKQIDAKKNEYTEIVVNMIEPHDKALKDIEQREADAEAARFLAEQKECDEILAYREDEEFEAEKARVAELERKEAELAAKQAEIEAKEAEHRAKQEEFDRIEREKRIAEEAAQKAKEDAERAKLEAEEKHQRELEAAENKRLADIQAAKDKAAAEQARREEEEAKRKAEEKAEQDRLDEIERKRVADKEHQAKINNEVLSIFTDCGMSPENAKKLVVDLAKGLYPALTINY
jgi:hypothetical protein